MLIDFHTHNSGNEGIFVMNTFPSDSIPDQTNTLFLSCGIHPWYVFDANLSSSLDTIEKLCRNHRIYAIGECGLDKNCADLNLQQEVFIKQVDLSEKYMLPLIIHSVKMHHEILRIHKEKSTKQIWIIHGYNGSPETANQYINQNIFLSLGPDLFRNRDKAIKLLNAIDINYVLLETDDSGIEIKQIYVDAAQILNISESELEHQIMLNFKRVFKQEWIG